MPATPTTRHAYLPHLFGASRRHKHVDTLTARCATAFAAEVLLRSLIALVFDPAARRADPAIANDPRFQTALSIAVPRSLGGEARNRMFLLSLADRASRLARERGVQGPAGRAIDSARVLAAAVLGAPETSCGCIKRSIDLSIEAEVSAGLVHDQDARATQSTAEERTLSIAQLNKAAGRGTASRDTHGGRGLAA